MDNLNSSRRDFFKKISTIGLCIPFISWKQLDKQSSNKKLYHITFTNSIDIDSSYIENGRVDIANRASKIFQNGFKNAFNRSIDRPIQHCSVEYLESIYNLNIKNFSNKELFHQIKMSQSLNGRHCIQTSVTYVGEYNNLQSLALEKMNRYNHLNAFDLKDLQEELTRVIRIA